MSADGIVKQEAGDLHEEKSDGKQYNPFAPAAYISIKSSGSWRILSVVIGQPNSSMSGCVLKRESKIMLKMDSAGSTLNSAAYQAAGWIGSLLAVAFCSIVCAGQSAVQSPSTSDSAVTETADQPAINEFIDQQLIQGWTDNEIKPSPEASDEEWVRRVYLDISGHIPSIQETRAYLADKSPRKRTALIDSLLEGDDFVRNWTTVWTNNCIGRGEPRRVSRTSMEKFFREAFAKRRPWHQVVVDLVAAEGHFEENGAVNYILAQMQMPDDGVQLTAITARLFLGQQVQCTQCHNHPFNKWQQDQFWELNSFFRQVDKIEHRRLDETSGQMVDDYSEVVWKNFDGPVFYEKRSGLMQVAFPKFQGINIDPDGTTDRRAELTKLLVQPEPGQPTLIAQAFVNRTWGQFFGYGFTRPVDDMGPHNPPSHPALLHRLAMHFMDTDYDVRGLIRLICSAQVYGLSSQETKDNAADNPAAGEVPLFSRMYTRSMPPEVLYDSLIVASNANQSGKGGWDAQEEQRRRWMQQFVIAFENDENDEATTFNGTIPQALMMMNSELMEKAVSVERGSFLSETLKQPGADGKKIEELYLAAFSRRPSRAEQQKVQKILNEYPGGDRVKACQDLFWALLNSNEFVFIH